MTLSFSTKLIIAVFLYAGAVAFFLIYYPLWTFDYPPLSATPGFAPIDTARVLNSNLVLTTPIKTFVIPPEKFNRWLSVYYRPYTRRNEFWLDFTLVKEYLQTIAGAIDSQPVNAVLGINSQGELYEKVSAQNGYRLEIDKSTRNIWKAVNQGRNSIALATAEDQSARTLEKIKSLGIDALLGDGQSDFAGSSGARINNIVVGAKLFNGVSVAPGEEFSFNAWLGEVTAATGYKPELVIKEQKLMPEYGGGLCQVSTTLFRAALSAGLPITERHSHSLPVRYYNPQGFDATVYPRVSDFRFKNDTAADILIQSEVNKTTVTFQIFGQSDGRQVSIEGPVVYESPPDGSLKTWLKRIVTWRDGTQQKAMFYSNYKSPALFPTVRNPLE